MSRETDDLLAALGFVPTGDHDAELAAARNPQQLLELLADRAARSLAAERAAGYQHFTVLHGDAETDLDVVRLRRLGEVARAAGALLAVRGGNDWTCYILRGRGAGPTMLALEGYCLESGSSWWRWTSDGTMPSLAASGSDVATRQRAVAVTPGAAVLILLIGLGVSVAVIRVAVRPLLLEVRALRVDVASGLALDRARRQSEESPAP